MKFDFCIQLPSLRYRKGRNRNGVQFAPKVGLAHWNGGSGSAKVVAEYLRAPMKYDEKSKKMVARSASYHFAIGLDGTTYQLVDTDDTAWHAGDGDYGDWITHADRVNEQSVGICMCSKGPVKLEVAKKDEKRYFVGPHNRKGFKGWAAYERYTPAQEAALAKLMAALKEAHPELEFFVGHQDVTRGKGDPGPCFEHMGYVGVLTSLGIKRMVHDWEGKTWRVLNPPATPESTPCPHSTGAELGGAVS